MKIGILTVPFNNNYGGFLQAFALKKVFTDLGHDVVFINRQPGRHKNVKFYVKKILSLFHLYKTEYEKKKEIEKISINTNQFKTQYLEPITEEYKTSDELKKCLQLGIDCFVVGSDQVWKCHRSRKDFIDDFYFNFLNGADIPRFSYAASMGIDTMEYPIQKQKICSGLLDSFLAISVREATTAMIFEKQWGKKNVQVVLDPTMLHSKDVYYDLFSKKYNAPQYKYLCSYILDETKELRCEIENCASRLSLQILDVKAQTGKLNKLAVLIPVEEWLANIYYADYVITDSFHGMVFSIIFNKPFIVYLNENRGAARVMDLLDRFGLTERVVTNAKELENKIFKEIDWNTVNRKRSTCVLDSLNFVYGAMQKVENQKKL